jgi:hypothetical protein
MKKILIAAMLSVSLAGCVTLQDIPNAITAFTTGVKNPVSKEALYDFENGLIVAFAGLNAYKKSCSEGAIPSSCKDVIKQLQVYTRQIPAALKDVRNFVKNNDMVNAQIAYDTARSLYTDFVAVATANNVKVQ